MPFIDLQLGQPASLENRRTLAGRATDIIVERLHKRREVTAVRVAEHAGEAWCVAGMPVAPALRPAHCVVYITTGTNSPAEKAACIADLHALLTEVLGPLPEASYIVIQEVPATDWGYAGLTQAARRPATR
ncbi:tautomerase family protein [Dechloromonas sp. H13]|uniref:tautomerase family protein n=1 Tax=Dechloromonas sp. H13 TaxID=2570193 RepID=UPI001292036D|nr:tautomerase family protein [Dechloromonas sp. H13]